MILDELKTHIESLEKLLQSPGVRHSAKQLEELLSDDFIEYGHSGNTYTKESIISSLSEEVGVEYIMWGFNLNMLSDDILQVTYNTKMREDGLDTCFALRSSIWRIENEKWRMLFHQGTPMHDDVIQSQVSAMG